MPRARSSGLLPKLSNAEPKIMDIISMADHKMNCLSQEVTKLQGELLLQTDTIEILEKQVHQVSIFVHAFHGRFADVWECLNILKHY